MEPQWDSPRGGGSDGEVIVVIVFGFGFGDLSVLEAVKRSQDKG
jgi:hypothetical protein